MKILQRLGILQLIFLSILINCSYTYELALVAIFQNEARFMKEWIEFYKIIGVQHFYLYNNQSADHYQQVLDPYIQKGEIEVIDWNHQFANFTNFAQEGYAYKGQYAAYNDALLRTSDRVKWLIFVDLDEYLFPVKTDNLLDFLKDYEQYSGVAAHWILYGTSYIKQIPKNGLMTEFLTYCNPQPTPHCKSIVRPKDALKFTGAHGPFYKPSCKVTIPSICDLRINHYWTRDEDYFVNVKLPRTEALRINLTAGPAWGIPYEDAVKMTPTEWAMKLNNLINSGIDTSIYKYLEKLKTVMFN